MNLKERNKPVVDILFLLALFCVFLISALFIVLFGAKIYKTCVSNMDENFKSRTALAYITEKVRCHDHTGGIEVRQIDGESVLVLSEQTDDRIFLTYLYEKDGYLCELTAGEQFQFNFVGGTQILPMENFQVESVSPHTLKLLITDENGKQYTHFITERSSIESEVATHE